MALGALPVWFVKTCACLELINSRASCVGVWLFLGFGPSALVSETQIETLEPGSLTFVAPHAIKAVCDTIPESPPPHGW